MKTDRKFPWTWNTYAVGPRRRLARLYDLATGVGFEFEIGPTVARKILKRCRCGDGA